MNSAEVKTSAHEPDDASVRIVLGFSGLVVAVLIIVWAAMAVHMRAIAHSQPDRTAANAPDLSTLPSRVNYWAKPGLQLAQTRATERQHLTEYAWIDRSGGIVRIPISRAMELVAGASTTRPSEGVR